MTAAAAETDSHIKQGCVSMCAAFIDTIIVCSVTGLVIAAAGLYGDRSKALEFLVKKRIYCYIYRITFCVAVYVGAVLAADKVWELSDIANACMMFPNLAAVIALSGGLRRDIINRADRT